MIEGNILYHLNEEGEPVHKVVATRIAELMYKYAKYHIQVAPEHALDWKHIFYCMVIHVLTDLSGRLTMPGFVDMIKNDIDYEDLGREFVEAMKNLRLDDTLQEGADKQQVYDKLAQISGRIDFWTTGDLANNIQENKILKSGLHGLLHKGMASADHLVKFDPIIASDKDAAINGKLDRFYEEVRGKPMLIGVFEDRISRLLAVRKALDEWLENKKRAGESPSVEVILARVLQGRHQGQKWPEGFQGGIDVENLENFGREVEVKSCELELNPQQVMLLLDVDDSLLDNRLMRLRQSYLMYDCLMRTLKVALRAYFGKVLETSESRLITEAIRANAEVIAAAYKRIIYPGDYNLNRILPQMQEAGISLNKDQLDELRKIEADLLLNGIDMNSCTVEEMWGSYLELYLDEKEKGAWTKPDEDTYFADKNFFEYFKKLVQKDGFLNADRRRRAEEKAAELEKELQENILNQTTVDGIKLKYGDSEPVRYDISPYGDVVRGGVVAYDSYETDREEGGYQVLWTVWSAMFFKSMLQDRFEKKLSNWKVVGCQNYYQNSYQGPPIRETGAEERNESVGPPFFGYKIYIRLDDDICYELQVLTRRVNAIRLFDPANIKRSGCKLTDKDMEYLQKLCWGAHLLDLLDLHSGKRENLELKKQAGILAYVLGMIPKNSRVDIFLGKF